MPSRALLRKPRKSHVVESTASTSPWSNLQNLLSARIALQVTSDVVIRGKRIQVVRWIGHARTQQSLENDLVTALACEYGRTAIPYPRGHVSIALDVILTEVGKSETREGIIQIGRSEGAGLVNQTIRRSGLFAYLRYGVSHCERY